MGRGTWWATVHGVTKSQTQLRDLTTLSISISISIYIFSSSVSLEDPNTQDNFTSPTMLEEVVRTSGFVVHQKGQCSKATGAQHRHTGWRSTAGNWGEFVMSPA